MKLDTKGRARARILAFVIAAAFAAAGGPVGAATGGHGHEGHAATQPRADGKRWPTDEPLREGMTNIRGAIDRMQHADGSAPGRYDVLGRAVDREIAYIVTNCRLEPQADAALHEVIGELSEGADVLTGRRVVPDRSAGVAKLVAALDRYGKSFDHPGWRASDPGR